MRVHLPVEAVQRIKGDQPTAAIEQGDAGVAGALADVESMVGSLTEHLMGAQEDPEKLYLIGLGAVPLLMAVGDLMVGWMLLREAGGGWRMYTRSLYAPYVERLLLDSILDVSGWDRTR